MPTAALPPGFKKTEEAYGITAYVFSKNGLRVLIAPQESVPVAGIQVTYHVGSRHESAGHTGATHILEHLMFKGSKKFDPKKGKGIWHLLEKKGAQMNATTWCDRTNYYAVVPVEMMEDVLKIEADRMRGILLKPQDLASEMTVVRNEYERGENDPYQRLSKHAWYQAFSLHPYRIPTIGIKEDIENVSVEKLRAFYDRFYHPNNATVMIVGAVDVPGALSAIARTFGTIPGKEIEEPPYAEEPLQEGERRFVLRRKGTVNGLLLCSKAPRGLADDAPAVSALTAVLGSGKSSLLYKALVDTGIAVDFHIDFPRFKDPSLIEIYATLSGGVPHAKAETVLWETLDRLKTEGVAPEVLRRAIAYASAEHAYSVSSVSGVLSNVNEAIARGDWKDAYAHPASLHSVTEEEVKAAASKYLDPKGTTTGELYAV